MPLHKNLTGDDLHDPKPHTHTKNEITDLDAVETSEDQTIAGVKTFTDSPVVPTPTTNMQAATKKYVDDNAGGGSPDWGDIGGTLSNQTDLQNALDAKFDSANVIDEDDMASDSDTKVPTQQSVKAYVDANSGGGGAGVSSNAKSGETGLTGDVTLSAGDNVTLTQSGNDIEIAASGGGGGGGGPEYQNYIDHHIQGDAVSELFTTFNSTLSQTSGGMRISIPAETAARTSLSTGIPYLAKPVGFWDRKVMGRVNFRSISSNTLNHYVHAVFGYPLTTVAINGFATIKSVGFHMGRSDSSMFAHSSDGTTVTRTDLSGTVGLSNSTEDLVVVHEPGVNDKFYRNGALVATHTTNVPSGNVFASTGSMGFFTGKDGDYPGSTTTTTLGFIQMREEYE